MNSPENPRATQLKGLAFRALNGALPMSEGLDSQQLLAGVQAGRSQAADQLFNRYVERLVALARSHMSPSLRTREDEEDVVQSVCRSFFTRAREGQYILQRSGDLWRLLAAITLNKVR